MCIDPFTLIAAGVSAAGSIMGAQQQSDAYKTQAQFADRQARVEQQQGAYEAGRLADQNNQKLAGMRASYAHAGVALEGSPTNVIVSSAEQASLDEQAIKYGAQLRSDNARFEGAQARANASSAMSGGVIGAITPFVNAFSQASQNKRTRIMNIYAMGG